MNTSSIALHYALAEINNGLGVRVPLMFQIRFDVIHQIVETGLINDRKMLLVLKGKKGQLSIYELSHGQLT